MKKTNIKLTVTENDSEQTFETYPGEYRNLMLLLNNKMYLDCFGECGGMGRCGTCIVKIRGLKGISTTKVRNEPVTLSRYGYNEEIEIRLSCQIIISTDLDEAIITILENN